MFEERRYKMNGLKPCPFCGSEPEISVKRTSNVQTCHVTCMKCGCRRTVFKSPHKVNIIEDAFKAWNTRKPIDKIIEQLEELRDTATKVYGINNVSVVAAICNAIEIVKKGGVE